MPEEAPKKYVSPHVTAVDAAFAEVETRLGALRNAQEAGDNRAGAKAAEAVGPALQAVATKMRDLAVACELPR